MSLIFDGIKAFISFLQKLYSGAIDAGLSPSPLPIIIIVFVFGGWLASACWASSIAESRLRSPKLHFFLALFVPILYPLIALFALKLPDEKKSKKLSLDNIEPIAKIKIGNIEEKPATEKNDEEKKMKSEEIIEEQKESEESKKQLNIAYFKILKADESINALKISYADTEVTAMKILSCLPAVLVIETKNEEGKIQKLRVPYAKMTKCEKIHE
ncbi:MAG: hypothetical protein U9O87_02610 [Verrucomicrobiota bacterium]|nr:hypothetical protein [Verrucomicrobiota bacterium]